MIQTGIDKIKTELILLHVVLIIEKKEGRKTATQT